MYVYVSVHVCMWPCRQKLERIWVAEGAEHHQKKLSCLGFSVVAIFPGKYSYLMYWMISEHLKNNCFQIKEPIVGNVGYK